MVKRSCFTFETYQSLTPIRYTILLELGGVDTMLLIDFMADVSEDLAGLIDVQNLDVVIPRSRVVPHAYRQFHERSRKRLTCKVCSSCFDWSNTAGSTSPSCKRSNYCCSICCIHLCVAPCFGLYHTGLYKGY